MAPTWLFAADRGGTFTDLVGIDPNGAVHSRKLRSISPAYDDAVVAGVRELLQVPQGEPIPAEQISTIRIGTTVATNALLERKGEVTGLLITTGFADLLEIGTQARPDIFALAIEKPIQLYQQVGEVSERIDAQGQPVIALNEAQVIEQLQQWRATGIRAIAIALMHSWINPAHELRVGQLARDAGFTQVSLSHQCMRVIKLVNRAQTSLVDAYLSPVLMRYVDRLKSGLGKVNLEFMQSSGGLADATAFSGKEAVLSGPAGGVVAVAGHANQHSQLIGFDMGGTSTDVCRFGGNYEYRHEVTTAGIAYHANMLQIETVAAGGGSILGFDGQRMTVGPESAGADPGPVCYDQGGPLTITDANLVLGRLLPETFPRQFGPDHRGAINPEASRRALAQRAAQINRATGQTLTAEAVAQGYIDIANQQMAKPIRSVSVARGYDLRDHALVSFGGAGGLHASELATLLGIDSVLIHPLAGIYSAWGIANAKQRHQREMSLLQPFTEARWKLLAEQFTNLEQQLLPLFNTAPGEITMKRQLDLRPLGSDSYLTVAMGNYDQCRSLFEQQFEQHYGYHTDSDRLELVNIRVIATQTGVDAAIQSVGPETADYPFQVPRAAEVYLDERWQSIPCMAFNRLRPGARITGPALLISDQFTLLIDSQFGGQVEDNGTLLLSRASVKADSTAETGGAAIGSCIKPESGQEQPDPITLEIYNHRFMGIAEQMGVTLQKTAHSVNMKERLDFSCAIFDRFGNLVANAPHIPVHLGAMGATIKALKSSANLQPGAVYASNHPASGGSHLPDVTVITPVFLQQQAQPHFFLASRGHHADIGGTTPGSMAPFSQKLQEEGVALNGLQLVADGIFLEESIRAHLTAGPWPARNIDERLADLRAQIAANRMGERELLRLLTDRGIGEVDRYMGFIQDNAAWAIDQVFRRLLGAQSQLQLSHHDQLDNGIAIAVDITLSRALDSQQPVLAEFDFSHCGAQDCGSLNAPVAVVRAAVMYVLRCLIDSDIPLNEGCLRNVSLVLPERSVVNPDANAAVVGGNVETSQRIVDVLLSALGVGAASQGTMNNLVLAWPGAGQYYETIGGGSGATATSPGASGVQVHMTNTRITDPEVLEQRFPGVRLNRFAIRRDSGGKGQQPGGDGLIRAFEILHPTTATLLTERRTVMPFGLEGGGPGKSGNNSLTHEGKTKRLPASGVFELTPGDTLTITTPGGGGYGKA